MSAEKKPFSNLDKLKNSSLKNFKNEKEQVKKNKNLLIKSNEDLIDDFKIIAFEYYKKNKCLSQFSFRHYLVLTLLNIEKSFKGLYGSISEPNEDYTAFYKKRGTKTVIDANDGDLGAVNFLIPVKYSDLYFNLMHTYYINECTNLSSYSISQFFVYIVDYVKKEKLENYTFHL